MSETYGPPCPFRSCGKTWSAGFYPYDDLALSIVSEHNGVTIDRLSKGMCYASNPYMQKWMSELGVIKAMGLAYRNGDGALIGRLAALEVIANA